ncbi:MAG: class I adenylate-forming enzyme family protein [Halobellus sp.]|uniref:class I adenylate-forming enzyme family protein n=1 Tax=Halobellus sp. TaxID=1979212 RepID=UPI0035D4B9B5
MRDWLSHRARIEPSGEALVVARTGDVFSFDDLDTLVEDLAGRLDAAGIGARTHLGAVLNTRIEYVCLVHAAMRVGARLVPMGDGLTSRELAGQFDTADVTAVVCSAPTESAVVDAVERLDAVERFTLLSVDDPSTSEVDALSETDPTPVSPADWALHDTSLVLFTSGTTGDPKAVQLTMQNLLASAVASAFRLGVDPDDRWLATLSLHHMGGIAPVLRLPLYGTTVVLRNSFEAGPTVDDIDRYNVTAVSLVPTMLRRMLERRGTLSGSLRIVLLGGAPASTGLIERCRDYSVPVHPTYGMTETASQIATARPPEAFESPKSVGRPLFFTEVTIVDDDGDPLPPGESGEIVVEAPTVTPGYYGDADATTEAFGPHGFHTGDVGVCAEDGSLTVLNRLDDRIVTGGENVDPGEVVEILRAHPSVQEAAVVGIPDAEWGERVSALVVPADAQQGDADAVEVDPSDALDRDDLLAFARERLAGFKLPKTVAIAESLPRTVSGTVDREAVRQQFSSPTAWTDDDATARGVETDPNEYNRSGAEADRRSESATAEETGSAAGAEAIANHEATEKRSEPEDSGRDDDEPRG